MKEKTVQRDVGVIIARFQLHELHEAHKDLINSVRANHQRVIIFLGLSPLKNTLNNPLEFKHRKSMIEDDFKDVEVHYIDDNRDDGVWSKNIDKQIAKWINPGQTVTLYGSRDSFLKCYHGKYTTCELESEVFVSATEVRKKIINSYPPTKDFRAGLIAATGLKYPTAYQTVDVAIVNEKNEFLMVKKPGETKWRFVGGFSDVRSKSLEEDVKREVMEETGVEISEPEYIGSALIDDWRFRKEVDKIKTAMFVAKYMFGNPVGADDVEVAGWVPFKDLVDKDIVMPEHKVLIELLVKKFINSAKHKEFLEPDLAATLT